MAVKILSLFILSAGGHVIDACNRRKVLAARIDNAGIDAPELKQKCKAPGGRDFLCGRAAAAFLLEHVRGGTVECRGNSEDRYASKKEAGALPGREWQRLTRYSDML